MRNTFEGFSQAKLVELDVSLVGAIYLRWFVDFKDALKDGKPVMKTRVINGRVYYWVKYESVLEEYPIIGVKSKDSVYRSFKDLVEKGLLSHVTIREGGTFSYYALGEKYLDLITSDSNVDNEMKKYQEAISQFEMGICKLKTTTTKEFIQLCEDNEKEFILSMIQICSKKGKTFKYFKAAIDEKVEAGINTKELLDKSIEEYRKEQEAKKIAALKEKNQLKVDENANEESEFVDEVAIDGYVSIDEAKELIKEDLTDTAYSTWFNNIKMLKKDKEVLILAPNSLTRDTVKGRYNILISQALEQSKINFDNIEYKILDM